MATNPDRSAVFPAIERKHGLPIAHWFDAFETVKGEKYLDQVAWFRENHDFSQAHASALVLYCRGSKSAHRYDSVEDYFTQLAPIPQKTMRAIFAAMTSTFRALELVMAWNQPMVRLGSQYVFGASVQRQHILLGPWGILEDFRDRLGAYEVNKKTVKVPLDWKVDRALLQDMAAARIAQIETGAAGKQAPAKKAPAKKAPAKKAPAKKRP